MFRPAFSNGKPGVFLDAQSRRVELDCLSHMEIPVIPIVPAGEFGVFVRYAQGAEFRGKPSVDADQ